MIKPWHFEMKDNIYIIFQRINVIFFFLGLAPVNGSNQRKKIISSRSHTVFGIPWEQ